MKLVGPPGLEEHDQDYYNDWELILRSPDTGHTDGLPPFLGEQSCNVHGTAPMDYFEYFFRDAMWGEIATQTNAYAQSHLERLGPDAVTRMDHPDYKHHSRLNLWKQVTAQEMRIFAAHLIILGVVRKPELEEYWSTKQLTRTPFFGRWMSRDRFQMILSNLHIADDSANPPRNQRGHNPLAKIQPFIDMIKPRFHDAYNPGLDISVDEGCCPWKGHLHFHLYNPSKPAKFHIKLFQVSDPSTGYVIHFKVYTGKDSCWSEGNTSDDAHNTVTTKTVMTLCADAGVLDKGHHIYFDNYFTSVDLMSELFIRSMAACGTARS